jgi:hypothetical protein
MAKRQENIMKPATSEQANAAVATDSLLTFIVKGGWGCKTTRKLVEMKLTEILANNANSDDQNEITFFEAAIKYIREAK